MKVVYERAAKPVAELRTRNIVRSVPYYIPKGIFDKKLEMFPEGLPHFAKGEVVKGFGRGSKELGCPTANYPPEVVDNLPDNFENGVYYGFANVDKGDVYKMVMSIGWNPFYQNTKKSMETHILHTFDWDFYGKELRIIILGYLRKELNFSSLNELIDTIKKDIEDAKRETDRQELQIYKNHSFFKE